MASNKNYTFEERKEMAMEYRKQGFNCAQSVVAAFPDILHLPMDIALKLTCGLGSGYGGLGKMCGVMSAMTLLEGVRFEDSLMQRAGVYKVVRNLSHDFKNAFGSLECKDIKETEPVVPCNEVITEGIRIYHEYITNQ